MKLAADKQRIIVQLHSEHRNKNKVSGRLFSSVFWGMRATFLIQRGSFQKCVEKWNLEMNSTDIRLARADFLWMAKASKDRHNRTVECKCQIAGSSYSLDHIIKYCHSLSSILSP